MADELEITNESINTAMHGLKNELNRLHQLHQNILAGVAGDINPEAVWTRIIVIQEELLNIVRAYSAKIKKEVEYEKGVTGRDK